MASCVVRDWQGKEAGQATLDLKVAKETTANDLMHRAVLRQQAHSRQGTASTLTRAEVRGFGPNTMPPPGRRGVRIEPWRARPVPFCL